MVGLAVGALSVFSKNALYAAYFATNDGCKPWSKIGGIAPTWQGGYTDGATPFSHPPIELVPPMNRLPIVLTEEGSSETTEHRTTPSHPYLPEPHPGQHPLATLSATGG